MKLLISFLAGAILAGLIFYLWDNKPDSTPPTGSTTVQKSDTSNYIGIEDVLIDPEEAKIYINNYQRDHDTARDNTITYSVFFGRSVMSYMGHYFDTAGKNVTGVRIFNIQYDAMKVPSQRGEKQQAVLFVPQDFRNHILWDEWKKSDSSSMYILGGLNHGELCPNNCPEEDGGG